MALYVDEEEVWKCLKHPSKRRRSGICPTCLRDRLSTLCLDCHRPHPCPCTSTAAAAADSSSSSSSGRVSNLLDGEPTFRRARSVAVPFLRRHDNDSRRAAKPPLPSKTASFLSLLKRSKTKRTETEAGTTVGAAVDEENSDSNERIEDFVRMVSRSRSVNAGTKSWMLRRHHDVSMSPVATAKGRRFWNFPSPMRAFRSSKSAPKGVVVAQDRSPLHRG